MEHIISTQELQELARPMSAHIDDGRLLVCIDEAERLDVVPNIGDGLFLDILSDGGTSEEVALLLEGGVYTDKCGERHLLKGLKSTVAYYAYARLIRLADSEVTRYGFRSKTDEYSEAVSQKEKLTAYTDAKIVADGYLREVKNYLNTSPCACGKKYKALFKHGRVRYNIIGE